MPNNLTLCDRCQTTIKGHSELNGGISNYEKFKRGMPPMSIEYGPRKTRGINDALFGDLKERDRKHRWESAFHDVSLQMMQDRVGEAEQAMHKRLNKRFWDIPYDFTEKLNSPWVKTQTAKVVCRNLMECIHE